VANATPAAEEEEEPHVLFDLDEILMLASADEPDTPDTISSFDGDFFPTCATSETPPALTTPRASGSLH